MDTDTVMIALLFVQGGGWITINDDDWVPTNHLSGKIPSEIGKASTLEIINLCK